MGPGGGRGRLAQCWGLDGPCWVTLGIAPGGCGELAVPGPESPFLSPSLQPRRLDGFCLLSIPSVPCAQSPPEDPCSPWRAPGANIHLQLVPPPTSFPPVTVAHGHRPSLSDASHVPSTPSLLPTQLRGPFSALGVSTARTPRTPTALRCCLRGSPLVGAMVLRASHAGPVQPVLQARLVWGFSISSFPSCGPAVATAHSPGIWAAGADPARVPVAPRGNAGLRLVPRW